MRRLLAAVAVLSLAASAGAADQARSVRVTVLPEIGAPPIAAGDLAATLDGRPARVTASRGPADDLMMLLVLDLTEDLGVVELAKEAMLRAVDQLPGNVYVGVMRAQDGLNVLVDPTPDRAAVKKAITELPVSGHAGLLDTIETTSRLADSILDRAGIRVALVYITDSSIYNYREDYINPVVNASDHSDMSRRFPEGLVREKISKLDAKLAAFQAPLFLVHLSYRSDRMSEAYQTGLMQLAATAGGTSAFCRSRAEVPEAISATLNKAAAHYSLVVTIPDHPAKIVQVQLDTGGRQLSYRSRFVINKE
ncbi:MAG TPA: VWA domain-containing protein [Bryobacteraceae bacterium]|nr:VWA domain-containing protein [Bryobacteraceae bacterium]